MLLLIDNYDSFTYNLYQYLSELGAEVEVVRNDQVTLEEIERMAPRRWIARVRASAPAKIPSRRHHPPRSNVVDAQNDRKAAGSVHCPLSPVHCPLTCRPL